jgi:hypothetical protein
MLDRIWCLRTGGLLDNFGEEAARQNTYPAPAEKVLWVTD